MKTVAACSVYLITGPSLIILNKLIFTTYGFPYPFLVSSLGLGASAGFAHLLVYSGYGSVSAEAAKTVSGWNYYRRVLPVGATLALAIGLGNLVYLYLGGQWSRE